MFLPWSFSPLVLRPALWLDASDRTTMWDATSGGSQSSASGVVARWEDKSGNGRHATQSTGVNQPLRIAASQNNRDIIRFDGSNDILSLTSGLDLLQNVSSASIFGVYKHNVDPVTDRFLFFVSTSLSGATRFSHATGAVSRKIATGGRRLDADTFLRVTSSADSPNVFFTIASVVNYSARTIRQYVNGSLDGTTDTFQTAGSTSNTASGQISVGGVTGSSVFASADVAEIIVFATALSDSDRGAVQQYLKTKWGTP